MPAPGKPGGVFCEAFYEAKAFRVREGKVHECELIHIQVEAPYEIMLPGRSFEQANHGETGVEMDLT
jgi:hypothetical protein